MTNYNHQGYDLNPKNRREQNHNRVLELFQEKSALKRRKLTIAAAPGEP